MGAAGPAGPAGPVGPAGPAPDTSLLMPRTAVSGQILSGHMAVDYPANNGGFVVFSQAWPIRLPAVSVPAFEFVATTSANCPGVGQVVPANRVCIYTLGNNGASNVLAGGGNTVASIRYGFSIDVFFATNPAVKGWLFANWAYKVP